MKQRLLQFFNKPEYTAVAMIVFGIFTTWFYGDVHLRGWQYFLAVVASFLLAAIVQWTVIGLIRVTMTWWTRRRSHSAKPSPSSSHP